MVTIEREMARWALRSTAVVAVIAGALGLLVRPDVALTAVLGVAVAIAISAGQSIALTWATEVSRVAVQVVALSGFLLRMGIVIALLFALSSLAWFSAVAFTLSVVPATLVLLQFESVLVHRGLGSDLARTRREEDGAALRS